MQKWSLNRKQTLHLYAHICDRHTDEIQEAQGKKGAQMID